MQHHNRSLTSSSVSSGGEANTIWYSTGNMAKGVEATSRHTLPGPLLASPWGPGRWPHHGSLSCLESQASGTG
ncbi:rCG54024 [Rattus norvegicus]|uniref:RCG54024 n=1 Tax=Rattus norvegicus TaxID=10116 RepID=A6J8B2_RAT|nr:rCG54024 [Rattus norvegicus]